MEEKNFIWNYKEAFTIRCCAISFSCILESPIIVLVWSQLQCRLVPKKLLANLQYVSIMVGVFSVGCFHSRIFENLLRPILWTFRLMIYMCLIFFEINYSLLPVKNLIWLPSKVFSCKYLWDVVSKYSRHEHISLIVTPVTKTVMLGTGIWTASDVELRLSFRPSHKHDKGTIKFQFLSLCYLNCLFFESTFVTMTIILKIHLNVKHFKCLMTLDSLLALPFLYLFLRCNCSVIGVIV